MVFYFDNCSNKRRGKFGRKVNTDAVRVWAHLRPIIGSLNGFCVITIAMSDVET